MRKLVLLMLVLGVASMASAGLVGLSVNGQANPGVIELQPSDVIELDVHALPGFVGGDFLITLSNAQGSLDGAGAVLTAEWTSTYLPEYGYIVTSPWDFAWGPVASLPQNGPQSYSLGGGNFSSPTIIEEVLMSGLLFHCDEPTDVIITLEQYVSGDAILMDELLVVQTPEPMTLGLLADRKSVV